MDLVLDDIVNDLNNIYVNGINFKNKYLIRFRIIGFSNDLIARSELFGLTGFTGKHSCVFCDIEGTSLKGIGVRFFDELSSKERNFENLIGNFLLMIQVLEFK